MSENEKEYWEARREREDEEYAYRQRRRKTLPWNIAAGVVLVLVAITFIAMLAGCSSQESATESTVDTTQVAQEQEASQSDEKPPIRECISAIEDRAGAADLTWGNSMSFPLEDGSISYQGDVDTTSGEHHSYLCDVDASGTVIRAGWLSDF